MTIENVVLVIGGDPWTARSRVAISYGATQAARVFAITVSDDVDGAWVFMPDTSVQLYASGDLVINGFLEVVSPSYDARDHKIELQGRSKSADTIDSAALHTTGEFRNLTILDIAKQLDKQGVGFKTDVKLEKVALHRLNPGETIFESLDRICRKQHLILIGQADGSILITKGGTRRVSASLVEGVNIIRASSTFDTSRKHSEYRVRGQRAVGKYVKGSLQIEQTEKDSKVSRNRPKVIMAEGEVDEAEAKKRAKRERDRQHGMSVKAEVTVLGWRDDDGKLWEPNKLVYVNSPRLILDQDLLIESVHLNQDANGTTSTLSLVHPKALDSNVSTGSKSNPTYAPGAPTTSTTPPTTKSAGYDDRHY